MSKVVLSKSGMQKERENLRLYRKVLPSLDLKRQQLMGEQKKAEQALAALKQEFDEFMKNVARQLPMLGAGSIELEQFIEVREVHLGIENVVGIKLPSLDRVEFEDREYSVLGTPHWVDLALERLRQFAELKAAFEIGIERARILRQAARKITQRVNLFEKILIPSAEKNIKRIQIYLSDAERAAVVQSKIAKAKGRAARAAMASAGEEITP